MLLTWDREPLEEMDFDPDFDLDGPPEKDDDDFDTAYTYVEDENEDGEENIYGDEDEMETYGADSGDDASIEAEDQPVFSAVWVGPSGKSWKVDFYTGDDD